jgi:DNA-binding MarR family transcriptional regulator
MVGAWEHPGLAFDTRRSKGPSELCERQLSAAVREDGPVADGLAPASSIKHAVLPVQSLQQQGSSPAHQPGLQCAAGRDAPKASVHTASPAAQSDNGPVAAGAEEPAPKTVRPKAFAVPGATRAIHIVQQAELAIRHQVDDLLKPVGVTALQYAVLEALERDYSSTLSELSALFFVKPQSMTDRLRVLHDRGLISRHASYNDGRRRLITLSPAGCDVLDTYRDQVSSLERRMLSGLSDSEAEELCAMLERCCAGLN